MTIDGKLPKTEVLVPPDIVIQALGNLLHNAIEADRPGQSAPVVELAAAVVDGEVHILISDNGCGIDGYVDGMPLRDVRSTKGRPEVGLADAELALIAANGSLHLVQTGATGTTFRIVLPTRPRRA